MCRTNILEKLSRLTDIYKFTEVFYIDAAVSARHSVISIYYEQRAFERLDFLHQLYIEKDRLLIENKIDQSKSIDETIASWKNLYGFEYLNDQFSSQAEVYELEKHLVYFLKTFVKEELPQTLYNTLNHQLSRIQAGLLSLEFLRKFVSK